MIGSRLGPGPDRAQGPAAAAGDSDIMMMHCFAKAEGGGHGARCH